MVFGVLQSLQTPGTIFLYHAESDRTNPPIFAKTDMNQA
jgi:hypothetical protein